MLRDTDKSTLDIALTCGFASASQSRRRLPSAILAKPDGIQIVSTPLFDLRCPIWGRFCPNGSRHRDTAVRRACCDSAPCCQLVSLQGSNGRCPNRRTAWLSGFPAEGLAGDEVGTGRSSVTKFARTQRIPAASVRPRECSRRAGPDGYRWPRRSRGTGCLRPQSRANFCQPDPSPAPGGTRRRGRGCARPATGSRRLQGSRRRPSASRARSAAGGSRHRSCCARWEESAREDRTPRSARPTTVSSTTLRTRRVPLYASPPGRAGSSSVAGRPRFSHPGEPMLPDTTSGFPVPASASPYATMIWSSAAATASSRQREADLACARRG